jgi:hypothetical protein
MIGKLPTVLEYNKYAEKIQSSSKDTFRYLNFHTIPEYVSKGDKINLGADYSNIVAKESQRLQNLTTK